MLGITHFNGLNVKTAAIAGGGAGTHTVTGVEAGDLILGVFRVAGQNAVIAELVTDHATFRTVAQEARAGVRTRLAAGDPALVIDTNFDVQNGGAITYLIDGIPYNLASGTTFDTGTAANMAADTWAVALLSVDSSGTATVTWDDNGNSGYADEATALSNIPATPANECPVGVVTVLTASGQTWTAGTDALEGGAGGNPSADTNYYDGGIGADHETAPPATLTEAAAGLDLTDLTGEFTQRVSTADTIDNTGGTATTGDRLLVIWMDMNMAHV